MVIVTRWTRTGPHRGIMADITEPMTVDNAVQFITAGVQAGNGTQGDYSWRDANSEPAEERRVNWAD